MSDSQATLKSYREAGTHELVEISVMPDGIAPVAILRPKEAPAGSVVGSVYVGLMDKEDRAFAEEWLRGG